MASPRAAKKQPTALEAAMRSARPAFGFVIFLSFFINMLAFVAPIYMMQIYGRVIMSRNMTTLLLLTLVAAALLISYAFLEMSRSRTLVRAGVLFDRNASDEVFNAVQRSSITGAGNASQGLRDLDQVREFLTGNGLIAICDAPWVPVFIIGCFLLHPWYGFIAIAGAVILFTFALLNDVLTRRHLQEGARSTIGANNYASATLRNAEVTRAMGMIGALRTRWKKQHEQVLGWQAAASDRAGTIMALTKFSRIGLQIAILGTGAYLVVNHNLSAGTMIAASIMMGRALAPVEQSVGNWRGLVSARQSFDRLNALLRHVPPEEQRMSLPAPEGELSIERLIAAPPGVQKPVLKGISFQVKAGEAVGVLGHSGAGKSTLARVLVGVWPYHDGAVRLDGTEMPHWNPEEVGKYIGYLPQDVELFGGTIAENISRFSDEVDHEKVIAAAKTAGVHELIQRLPEGYNTDIADGGRSLSGGQRQRIGLARAVYGEPSLIILDEPNSNLDSAGEAALMEAVKRLRELGKTIILITHKASILGAADKLLVMNEGALQLYGPRDEILARLSNPRVVPLNAQQGAQNQKAAATASQPPITTTASKA